MSILFFFKENKACHNHRPEQYELWKRLVKCKHIIILYLSRMEIPTLVVGNFELKSYPKGWEVWPQIFVFDLSPHRIPCILAPPLPSPTLPHGHNIERCI